MTDLPRCWAHNRNGNRCEKNAGHAGKHQLSTTWADNECLTPGQPANPVTDIPPVAQQERSTKCVACHHKHKGSACNCGCYEFVG